MNGDTVIQAMEAIIQWVFALFSYPHGTALIASSLVFLLGWRLVPVEKRILKVVVLLIPAFIIFALTYGAVGMSGIEDPQRIIFDFLSVGLLGLIIAWLQISHDKKMSTKSDNLRKEMSDKSDKLNKAIADRSDYLNAIAQLGNPSVTVRMVGIKYLIDHCVKKQDNKYEAATKDKILQLFNDHIRYQTRDAQYQASFPDRPAKDIQKLINVLVGKGYDPPCEPYECIDWQGAYLRGADLQDASLQGADLVGTQLQGANLWGARLQGANLDKAQLQGACLFNALLHGAFLWYTRLQGAELNEAKLHGAILLGAQLQGAILSEAKLHGAILVDTQLQGADLTLARLQGANLAGAQLQGADLEDAHLQGVHSSGPEEAIATRFAKYLSSIPEPPGCQSFRLRIHEHEEEETEVDEVVFEGGSMQETITEIKEELEADYWKRPRSKMHVVRVENALEVLKANKGEEQTGSIDKAEERGAHTGTYGEKEARKWIREYEEVVPSVSDVERLI